MTTFLDYYKEAIHNNSKAKGFYDGPFNVSEKLMLVVSEVSEAMEAVREQRFLKSKDELRDLYDDVMNDELHSNSKDGNITDELIRVFKEKVKGTFEDELADVIIRVLDLCQHYDIDIELHIAIKHWYNKTRPFKHGKQF